MAGSTRRYTSGTTNFFCLYYFIKNLIYCRKIPSKIYKISINTDRTLGITIAGQTIIIIPFLASFTLSSL